MPLAARKLGGIVSMKKEMLKKHGEFIAVAIIILIAVVITFVNLGDVSAPQTSWTSEDGIVRADFGEVVTINEVIFLNGISENVVFNIHYSTDTVDWAIQQATAEYRFSWEFLNIAHDIELQARYIVIEPISSDVQLMELAFKSNGRLLPLTVLDEGGIGLFDEQHLIPDYHSFKNSMYFDEQLFTGAAYAFVHGLADTYEEEHPPLGKVIIASGIKIFGMTPFGYRFMGALFGLLMLPLIYAFARRLFGSGIYPVIAVALFATDFMRFTMSRMATVEPFLIFFIIASWYFMFCYIETDFKLPLKKLLLPLALSGLFMGLAISVKWSGLYSALGLAVIFFIDLWNRYKESPKVFKKHIKPLIRMCFVFFGIVPFIVYFLSYIPYMSMPYMNGFQSFIDNQIHMFTFHSSFPGQFDFEAPWYLWPFNIKPILLSGFTYFDIPGIDGMAYVIILMGNPVVWYLGLAALVYSLIRKFDRDARFLIIAYAAQIVPWMFISRSMFIYHYFPCVAFLVLLLTRALAINNRRKTAVAVGLLAVCVFIFYLPITSGITIERGLLDFYLQTLPAQVIFE
jgi:dolichyl-phosphate-mannose--protein O-mannosyl transferase